MTAFAEGFAYTAGAVCCIALGGLAGMCLIAAMGAAGRKGGGRS